MRLQQGDTARMTAFSDEPAETTRRWLETGARWLHVVNLDGAFGESNAANRSALEEILAVAKSFGAHVQFGGGLRSLDAIDQAIELGISRAVLGTIAIERPDVVANALTGFGAEQITVGIDARDGLVRVHGWKDDSGIPATELALQMRTLGLRTVIFTDVSRDGMGCGLNIARYARASRRQRPRGDCLGRRTYTQGCDCSASGKTGWCDRRPRVCMRERSI